MQIEIHRYANKNYGLDESVSDMRVHIAQSAFKNLSHKSLLALGTKTHHET